MAAEASGCVDLGPNPMHRVQPRSWLPRSRLLALSLAGAVATGCAYEWVSTRPEIERYELESAKKICRRWAHKQLDDEESAFGHPRPRKSTRSYQSYFSECMRKHGWTREPVDRAEEAADAEESGERE